MNTLAPLISEPQTHALLTQSAATVVALCSLAAAGGMLSLVVIWRRWAFLGEGVAHAGFGGAGTAWMLAAALPALDRPGLVQWGVVAACLVTAVAIGVVHRSGKVHSDTAIGAFLAGTLAWGFLGQRIYANVYHREPAGFAALLFGQTQMLTPLQAQLAVALLFLCAAVLGVFRKQVLLYCFDPELATASGVRSSAVHYLLILLVTMIIIAGSQLIGTVMITALLILPGATAMLLCSRLASSVAVSCGMSLLATFCGLTIASQWPGLPAGPLIVLTMFLLFLGTWLLRRKHA